MRRTSILLVLASSLLAACQPHYDGLRIHYLNTEGSLSVDGGLKLEEGQALAVDVEPISDNPYEDYEEFDLVDLRSYNQNVVLVAPADRVNRFVFVGVHVGDSAVEVVVDDKSVDTITATVEPQEVGQ